MPVTLNHAQVVAISKLDFSGHGHLKRLDMIANALGHRNQGTLMSVLKRDRPAPARKSSPNTGDVSAFVRSVSDRLAKMGGIIFITGATNSGKTSLAHEISDAVNDAIGGLRFVDIDTLYDRRGGEEAVRLASRGAVVIRDLHGNRDTGMLRAWDLTGFSEAVRRLAVGHAHAERDDKDRTIFSRHFATLEDGRFGRLSEMKDVQEKS